MTEPPPPESPPPPPLRRHRRGPGVVRIAHAVALLAFVALLKAGADRWGWATLLAYGPRWPWLVPGGVIAIVAALRRRRAWPTIAVTLLVGVWLLDARVPAPRWPAAPSVRLRILTLNADGGNTAGRWTDPARIARLIADAKPDVMLFQEWQLPGPPPLPTLVPSGHWNVRREGQLLVVSRMPITAVASLPDERLLGESAVFGCRIEAAPGRPVWVFTPHLETPRRGFDRVLSGQADGLSLTAFLATRRQTVSERAVAWVVDLAGDADVLVGGDFNLVADGRVFRTTWADRFTDAFGAAGWGTGGTKLQTGWRPRIDHVLTGTAWRASKAWVGPDVGSDHLPLLADVERP